MQLTTLDNMALRHEPIHQQHANNLRNDHSTEESDLLGVLEHALNALSAHIAVLDVTGEIIAVNRSWCQFGLDNGASATTYGVGVNYLHVCDTACGPNSEGHQLLRWYKRGAGWSEGRILTRVSLPWPQ